MNYRTAIAADAKQIAKLHADSWSSALHQFYSRDYLENNAHRERTEYWTGYFTDQESTNTVIVSEADNTITGFISLYGNNDPEWGTFISNLHVSPAMKGRGTGRQLLRQGGEWAQEHFPDSGIYLWVITENTPATGFYEHMGGKRQAPKMRSKPDGGQILEYRYIWESPGHLINCVKGKQ